MKQKILSMLLAVCLIVGMLPTTVFATEDAQGSDATIGTGGLCNHHTEHTAECGYVAAAEESPCTHECGEDCTQAVTACVHTHDNACGYTASTEEVPCSHECGEECTEGCVHTEHTSECGYVKAQAGTPCTHTCTAETDCVTTAASCTHVHDDACGYMAAVEGHECHYECDECAAPKKVCTCGTDEDAVHATNCPAYVAPEEPVCLCVEKCTEDNINVWCDVCGVEGMEACTAVVEEAGDTWEGTVVYDPEDVKVVKTIIESSPTLQNKYPINDDFSDWNSIEEVTWGSVSDNDAAADLYRVTELHLNEIEDLNELDVSGLEYLQELECGNTSITELDLSQNKDLLRLYCYGTGITELNLSANTALEVLDCNNTGITALELSQNIALQSLGCSNTGIATLDLSRNTALESLACNDTSITALHLSNNKMLSLLYCNTIVSPAGEFSLKDMNNLTYFRIAFVGSEVEFVSCSGHKVSLSVPEDLQVESVYTCMTDESDVPIIDGDGKVLEKFMWTVLSVPEDYVCLRYSGLSEGIRFEEGEGTYVTIDNNLEIEAKIVTEEEVQPGIGIEGVAMNPVYHSRTLNYAATVGYDVSKVTLTGALASSLPDAVFEGLGEKELNVGENTFQVTLRIPLFQGSSDYGFNCTYTILVTREDNGDSGQDNSSDDTPYVPDEVPTTPVTVPVSGDENTIHVDVTISKDTVTMEEIPSAELEKVIGNDVKTGVVEIDLTGLGLNIDRVNLPTNSIKAIAEAAEHAHNDTEALAVLFHHGTVKLDAKTMRAIVEQAECNTIRLVLDDAGTERLNDAQKAAIANLNVYGGVEAYLLCVSANKRISDFKGGVATLSIPFTVPAGHQASAFSVWYVSDAGDLERLDTWYADGMLHWNVGHFSDFVIVYGGSTPNPGAGDDTLTYVTYTVQKSDTLWAIAKKYGCTVADIVAANSDLIKNPDLIYPGWQLKIPQGGTVITDNTSDAILSDAQNTGVYIVKQGDTLWAIAKKYGCTVAEIVAQSGDLITDPDLIFAGWELLVPET